MNQAFKINVDIASAISYAAWQNSVPILRSLSVSNQTSDPIDRVELRMSSTSNAIKPKTWQIDRLIVGEPFPLNDCSVDIAPNYLAGLNEAEKSEVSFEVVRDGEVLASEKKEVRVLARDQWGGMEHGGELVAAFVMPNDAAIATILKKAAAQLEANGQHSALDGYQSGDPQRAYVLAMAVWNAVATLQLTYANPPASFESLGQKTRTPQTVLQQRLATCLDTSLLFASALEAVGLNPVVVMMAGHCFVGVWLVESTLNQVVEKDASEIRKAIASNELVTFETTLVSQSPPAPFEIAIQEAAAATDESKELNFVAAIDVKRCRMAQILPLASNRDESQSESEDTARVELLPFTLPPESAMPIESVMEMPTSSSGRIDRWQRKLLDLTLRNRLLNFRATLQSIPILCNDIAKLEDLLAGGKRLKMISLPDQNPIGDRDRDLHRKRTNADLDSGFAAQSLDRNELSCLLPTEDLERRLTTIYRAVRNDLAEGGSNTLFLAIGFLRWRQNSGEKKTYRAPLLLMPVKLTRRSSRSPFHLQIHEDETRFNATLIQLLKQDFGKDLSVFESNLPKDKSGVDVPLLFQQVRQLVRDIAGFEVVDESAIGRFSFAKYLLWRDLVDRTDQLKNNRVVKHLLDNPEETFDFGGGTMPQPKDIDRNYDPVEIYHPLDADSSQLAAVMAVAAGKDIVLIGPPGTGKSQTIANMISQCLAMGKTILFVAEKTAALEVVYRRLQQHGLGDCCVELHSNKAERRKFLAQLDHNWQNNRRVKNNDWVKISERLKVSRDQLNDYVQAIHEKHPNGWSAFQAFGIASRQGDFEKPKFGWPATVRHDLQDYQRLESAVKDLSVSFAAINDSATLPMIGATEWSMGWEKSLLSSSKDLKEKAVRLKASLKAFTQSIGLTEVLDASSVELKQLQTLGKSLVDAASEDVSLIFKKQFRKFPEAIASLKNSIDGLSQAKASLGASYDRQLRDIPLEQLDLQWRQAVSKFWPFSWFAKRSVTRLLQTYAESGIADAATDLNAIRLVREHLDAIDTNELKDQTRHWNGSETNLKLLENQIRLASQLRGSLKQVGDRYQATNAIAKAVLPSINGRSADSVLMIAAQRFLEMSNQFWDSVDQFGTLAGRAFVGDRSPLASEDERDDLLQKTVDDMQYLLDHRTDLKRWTQWCQSKGETELLGLTPLVAKLEQSKCAANDALVCFRSGYADWLIPTLIDQNPILRKFESTSHENAILEFRELDRQARELASGQARRAIAHGLPAKDAVTQKSELGMLRHQAQLKRPSKSIRDVVVGMPDSFRKLAPCLLMSPLSIAQYLPAVQEPFDVVIFDEASQIPTWDAIGAIARGKQTVIVGDPKQLPPTNFFGKLDDEESEEDLEYYDKDLESILDEALASGLPELSLNWHYRSRHESLIAYSNYRYYQNRLITFPAAEDDGRGLSLVKVPDAHYDLGKSRTNRVEAEAIVAAAVEQMKANLNLPKSKRLTFGVITFNMQQQSLIQDLFESACQQSPEIEWYFSDDRVEPTVVKNLENVQGDERDVMFFSITFGPTETNPKISRNFGALNRDGGERRLNVAITRARRQMLVYSSFSPEQLDVSGSKSAGLSDLKQFLVFAESGGEQALGGQTQDSVGGFDSPFEESVAEALESRGWRVLPQIGVSGFRIDLGIRHPDNPGAYLAGIECDGATYHRSAAARDRDMTRQLVLEGLGWNILRVWSPDWWYTKDSVVAKLDERLNELLNEDRAMPDQELESIPDSDADSSSLVSKDIDEKTEFEDGIDSQVDSASVSDQDASRVESDSAASGEETKLNKKDA